MNNLGKAKEALALLAGRSIAIPNQALLVNGITLQETKDSSAIENVFTTEDDLYQAFSDKKTDDTVSADTKEVLPIPRSHLAGLPVSSTKRAV